MSSKPLPIGTPTEFEVAKVEEKRKTAKGKVYRLGLIGPNEEKGWAELYVHGNGPAPAEGAKETFVIEKPDNPDWELKAKRPGRVGGGRKNDVSIEAQVAFKGAVEWALAKDHGPESVGELTKTFLKAIREAQA